MTQLEAATTTNNYETFLASKRLLVPSTGIEVDPAALHPSLFPFQRDLVRWSLRKGRAALFADTGLGKSVMQLEWARQIHERTGQDVLILAPLAVAQQTVAEGRKFGLSVQLCQSQADVQSGINVTNYDRLHLFSPSIFGAVVLDESSILKALDGKTRRTLTEVFAKTSYRLCCTATPAPNDIAEIANHAEFLGILTRSEMLAAFFVHDDAGWRLKGHARQPFYRWLASWGMSLKRPSDLGYSDDGYDLPPLEIRSELVSADYAPEGQLFFTGLKGIQDRTAVRRATIADRIERAARLIRSAPERQWLAWVGLNDEGRRLAQLLPEATLLEGGDAPAAKESALTRFAGGEIPILITKCSIAGFGMNFQRCNRMVFVGLGDSFEQYYQAIRRCWRFGQTESVYAHIVLTEPEEAIYQNVLRKEQQATEIAAELIREVSSFEREEIGMGASRLAYLAKQAMRIPNWLRSMVAA